MRIIPTRVHGVLDYLTALIMLGLPRLTSDLGWSERATTLLMAMAIITLLYSLLTRYELGAFRLLPMAGHLVLDFLSGAFLVTASFLFLQENSTITTILVVLGVFEIGASLFSQATSSTRIETNRPRAI